MFPDDPAIAVALAKLLADPDSPWRPALAGTNGTIGLAGQLASTPLLGRAEVREYMLAGLAEEAQAGTVIFSPSPFRTNDIIVECKFNSGWDTSQNAQHDNKLPADTTTHMPFRVCDLFAEQLASVDSAPPFAMSWPLQERDKGIAAIAEFIHLNGDKLAGLVEQKRKRECWRN